MPTVPSTTRDLSTAYVRDIFKKLESGDGKGFFDHVFDAADWIVEGTHPLAGHYHGKADLLSHTFEKLAKLLPQGAKLCVEHVLVSGDWAVVELRSEATAKNGPRFDNRYCWICRFGNGTIVEVRAYLDSALIARLFEEPRLQAPYWYRFNVGEAEITVVSDGWQMLGDPTNSFLGVPKDEVRKQLTDNFMNPSDMNIELNSFVVRRNAKMVLFDTGLGTSKMYGPKGGLLAKSLSDAGIKREDIDAVVISHGHIDHIGGIVDESGALMYPNAQFYMSKADFDYWTDERQMDSPWKNAFIIHARKNLLPVRDRLTFFKDDQEFLPGITAIAAPGHTLGHTMFHLQSNGQSFVFVGDISHHSVLLIENPRMEFVYDTDAKEAVKTRLKILPFLAENRIPILAYHFAWPGYGHFVKQGEGFRYQPAAMNMNL